MNFEITPSRFYRIGMWSFVVIAMAKIANFFLFWGINNFWDKMGSLAGIIFNLVIIGFFKYLLSLEPKEDVVASSDDIDEIIDEISGEAPKETKGGYGTW